jgi:tripartite-type tricarboxylate transporter receptor subunit TctC
MLLNMLNSLPHVRSGRLKGLAITSLQRSRFAPELPTLDESGLKGYEIVEWYGVAVPANTPKQIVAKLHDEFGKAMNSADIKDRLDKQAVEVRLGSSAEFGAFLKSDVAKYLQIVKDAGIRPE